MLKWNKKNKILVSLFITAGTMFADPVIHIVKKGETLSQILYKMKSMPIYGKKGSLEKTIALNPFLKNKSGNFILPKMKIILPMQIDKDDNPLENTLGNNIISSPVENNERKIASNESNQDEFEKRVNEEVQKRELEKENERKNAYDPEQYFFIRVLPQISWMKVASTNENPNVNAEINALSKVNPGGLFTFGIKATEEYKVQSFAYLSQVNFYQDPIYTLDKDSFFRQAYGVGVEKKINDQYSASLRVGMFDEFFLTLQNRSQIKVEMAQIPEIHWGIRKKLGAYKKIALDTGIFGKFILPHEASTINGKFGYGLGGDVLGFYNNKGLRLFYNISQAKAENKSTNTYEIGWNLVFETRFFD